MKLSNFFIVKREGLEKRWWHRLVNVLIYGSTAFLITYWIIAIIADGGFTSDSLITILAAISVGILWFIFWESIVYRALIYVIYGKPVK